ncbi:Arc family DNA-binding protein [Pseudomonas aeruginosa]|uniref:Arc family DNA-binding protein n=1 Tax=Pseudomonas aeruginosa TaxID=287 RepID=UPI000729B7A4|nr:Arc family DNA-binding protein [Pseudomonas aeruginosa]KRU79037.1 hypothetical protein AN449_30790 [Pseudomonas aeruginosa]MDP5478508.1 Arc family DNA-binding protein [Pseudomonas aeruginosa]MDP5519220.1 Arc family DNA-binding protein [Pseudomonas aeruginosa]RQJ20744.1 Arc family DNA-binding protein [Pseudomonas aeruginosa]
MSRDITPFALRMTPALREKVEQSAKENHRSLNAEIVARLEQTFGPSASEIRGREDVGILQDRAAELTNQINAITFELESMLQTARNNSREGRAFGDIKGAYTSLASKKSQMEMELQQINIALSGWAFGLLSQPPS